MTKIISGTSTIRGQLSGNVSALASSLSGRAFAALQGGWC
jgi:hypothetical protein